MTCQLMSRNCGVHENCLSWPSPYKGQGQELNERSCRSAGQLLLQASSFCRLPKCYVRVHTEPRKFGKQAIFTERQGKHGVVRQFPIICIQARENKLFSPHVVFINLCMVVGKLVVPFVSVNVDFIAQYSALESVSRLRIYWVQFSLHIFVMGVKEDGCFLLSVRESQGIVRVF